MKQTMLFFLVATITISAIQSCSKDTTKAPDNLVCDTTKSYTYTTDVKPIFDTHCASIGCHGNIAPAQGIVLSDFASAKLNTETGTVICAMKHTCNPMPIGQPKLSNQLIQAVECWAAGGFQN